jgi:hypothetical protein
MMEGNLNKNNKAGLLPKGKSRLFSWLQLISILFVIWLFAVYIGPRLEKYIPGMSTMTQVIENQSINANAYFYTEIEETYQGERYLRESLAHSNSKNVSFTWPFLSGIFLCIAILSFGYRYM